MDAIDFTSKATILVVDDTPDNLALLSGLLKDDYKVKVANNGENALKIAAADHPPDLILLDIMMPGMDGLQVASQLKTDPATKNIPIIMVTALDDRNSRLAGLNAGAEDFLTKPVDPAELLVRVRNLLRLKEYSKALEQTVQEVKASHELISRQRDEVKSLYDQVAAEQKRSLELSEQFGIMVGIEKGERLASPWYRSMRLRHPWLQINLLIAFIAAGVVEVFIGTIERLMILIIFLPVLAGLSGNIGGQALAITLRGITLGELKSGKEKVLVIKEALLGLLNGALVGLVAAIVMYVLATAHNLPSAPMLSAVVFLAMIGSCVISSICGTMMPLTLKKLGADPATSSSLLLTTTTDVVSMVMLLGLATVLVK